MPNIESLTSFNFRYVCVGATALFTVLSFLTFWVSGNKADLLSKTKDELAKLKDREQAIQISKVKTDSQENVERVRTEAEKQIALLNAETTKAQEGIAIAQEKAAQANAEAANANQQTEKERLKRLELERSLVPRTLPFILGPNRTNFDVLKPFADTKVVLYSLRDVEPSHLVEDLSHILSMAGWNIIGRYQVDRAFDGMTLFTNDDSALTYPEYVLVLEAFLSKYGLYSRIIPSISIAKRELPFADKFPDILKIAVGAKPQRYFDEIRHEESEKQLEEFKRGK